MALTCQKYTKRDYRVPDTQQEARHTGYAFAGAAPLDSGGK